MTQPADTFIGRRDDLEAIDESFAGRCRLVTLIGHGGIGKTRLALEYAAMRSDPDLGDLAVRFIELADTNSLESLVERVARAFQVPLDGDQDPIEQVEQVGAAMAAHGELLVVLDNLEQVIDAAAQAIRMWRLAAPSARFLVTSRMPLELGGEQRIELGPLSPGDSGALFEARARAADHRFVLSEDDAGALVEIVKRLDGIPLAIELAAARTSAMSIASLSARLAKSFDVLRSSRRDRAPRQAALSNAIEWSWQLLPALERDALTRLTVFVGSFSISAASAVLETDAANLVRSLREHSLLVRLPIEGKETRFRLYEPVREQVAAKIDEGVLLAARARHAEHFAEVAGTLAMPGTAYGTCGLEVIEGALADMDNMVAALEHSLEDAPASAARIGLALIHLQHLRDDPPHRNRGAIDAAVAAAQRSGDDELRCRLLIARAAARQGWRESTDLEADLRQAHRIAGDIGSGELEGLALLYLGIVLAEHDRSGESEACIHQSVEVLERAGAPLGLGIALENLAITYQQAGRGAEASVYRDRAIEAHREAGNRRSEAISLRNRADWLAETESLDRALADTETAFQMLKDIGTRYHGITMINLAQFAAQSGDLERARQLIQEVIDAARRGLYPQRAGDPYFVAGWIELVRGDLTRAEELLNEGLAWNDVVMAYIRPNRLIARGAGRLLAGRIAAARDDLCAAVDISRRTPEVLSDAAVAAALLAALEYAAERFDQVWPWLAVARAELVRWQQPRHRRVIEAIEELFESRSVPAEGVGRKPFLEEIVAGRVATAIRKGRQLTSPFDLRVGPDTTWLELPNGTRVELGNRPVLQRIVRELVTAHREGRAVPSAELIAAVWPDDRSDRRSLENRLWVAMSALRRLGLADVIRKQSDGYTLG